jgi:hypothetical protein
MGIEEITAQSLVNFIIYGCFIFIMTILFINIFTGISIDEIQGLIQHSEAQIQSRKIDYVFKIETLNKRYFKYFKFNKFLVNNFKVKSKINANKGELKQQMANYNKTDNINDELDKLKNQMNELKIMIQTKFESNDRNTKKMNQNIDERLENIEDNLKIRQMRFEANKQRHPYDLDDNQQQYDDIGSLKERYEDIPKR